MENISYIDYQFNLGKDPSITGYLYKIVSFDKYKHENCPISGCYVFKSLVKVDVKTLKRIGRTEYDGCVCGIIGVWDPVKCLSIKPNVAAIWKF